jgi:hypothetical protein
MNDFSEVYKTMLERESSNHTVFITVLLGIVVILLGATWWWNFFGANKRIKTEVRNKFKTEKDKFDRKFEKKVSDRVQIELLKYEQKILEIEGDVIRSLALQARNGGHYSHSIYWWTKHLNIYYKLEVTYESNMRNTVKWILIDIELLKNQDIEKQVDRPKIYKKEYIIEIISKLSNLLSDEKKEILDFVSTREEFGD